MPNPHDNIEKRAFEASYSVETSDGSVYVTGMGAVYNRWSLPMVADGAQIGQKGQIVFREKVRPGAFARAIQKSDPRALRDHIPHFILGRLSAGTLEVKDTSEGLWYRYKSPDTTYAKDLLVSMERGDVRESSYSFVVADMGEIWEQQPDGTWTREITDYEEVFDVSPVTYPAFPDTSVAIRSLAAATKTIENPQDAILASDEPTPDPLVERRARFLDILQEQ